MKLIKLLLLLAIAMLPMSSITAQDATRSVKPTSKIDKRLVGWQEAGLGNADNRIGNVLRANWVMLSSNGAIEGQVVGISQATNVYMLRNGFVVGRAVTEADGRFSLESASPGPYTLVGYSPDSIFAYSFNAVANDGTARSVPLGVQTLPVTGAENNRLVARLIEQYSPQVNFRDYGTYDFGETNDDPAAYYGFNGLKDLDESAAPATSVRNHQVAILNDGRMVGRIHQLHNRSGRPVEVRNSRVIMIQQGQVIAETQVDSAGVFEIEGLTPGTYGLVAFGNDGILVVGVDLESGGPNVVMPSDETARKNYDPLFRNVSEIQDSVLAQSEESFVFDACLCNPDSVGWLNDHVTEETYTNALLEPRPQLVTEMPFNYFDQSGLATDSFGGDFFGGGGGFGGGIGGFGNLLLPIGIAAIIAEAADDDDNNGGIFAIPPVSPFEP